ncbi:MAG: hypothetical protein MUF73_16945 [Rhodobacteraceae bacterium]|jgi:hypothetical protein|nr:hypothetical protein [Paracoccaceae bacterium]
MPRSADDRLCLALAVVGALFALATPAAAAPGQAMLLPGLPLLSAAPLVVAGAIGLALSVYRRG